MATLTGRFDEAFAYTHETHAGHTRKGSGVPYLGHLMGVASIVIDDGGSEDEAIGALLHDAAEDCGGRERLEDILIETQLTELDKVGESGVTKGQEIL